MTTLSRYAAMAFAIVVLATFLPRFFWQAMDGQQERVQMVYSSVAQSFLFWTQDRYGRDSYHFETGEEMDRRAYALLLPFRFARDLVRWGEMPEQVGGVDVNPETLYREVQEIRMRPRSLGGPEIPLYHLLEAASGFADLEMPKEVLRLSGKEAVFIRLRDGRPDMEKSQSFTEALERADFHFPAKKAWGNPTTRKPFDWGLFVLDARGDLFHLMQVQGRAVVRAALKDFSPGVRHVHVEEHRGRHVFGMLVDERGGVYRMNFPDYALKPLPLKGYDPSTMRLVWRRDPLVHQYTVMEDNALTLTVTDHGDNMLKEKRMELDPVRSESARKMASFLFPFRIFQSFPDSGFLTLRADVSRDFPLVTGLGLFSALFGLFLWRRFLGISWKASPLDWLVAGGCGFFGLLAIIWAGHVPARRLPERGKA
ncbi:DUF4857 domain-containing protein [Desulfobotulus sp.]|uniref:DUF4857 domain-containing protein n=1 Tax=Desulfobotulus sp. TaxID=1940337 RepID=UPI002A3615AF|nr:DUF4857 domain-containing protein [Desulfobotulus sp.]MDY0162799.1 DUF4857 domain-containing protein [Desulfobotulus sp.]